MSNDDDDTRAPQTDPSWRDMAVEHGMKFARYVFEKRGNHSEAHITEAELAAMMAVSFERGACRATTEAAMLEAREGRLAGFTTVDELLTDLRRDETEPPIQLTRAESMQMLDMIENPKPRSEKFKQAMVWYQQMRAEQWQRENAEAIRSSNKYVEKHGLPLAKYRMPRDGEEGEHGEE